MSRYSHGVGIGLLLVSLSLAGCSDGKAPTAKPAASVEASPAAKSGDEPMPAANGSEKEPAGESPTTELATTEPANEVAKVDPNAKPTALANGLIPRSVLFGNPQRAAARISPDGTMLSFLAPVDGVLNIWVAPVDKLDEAKPITHDTKRGIRSSLWTFTSKYLLYEQDTDGDENDHIFRVDAKTGETTDLTPIDGVKAQIEGISERLPTEALVGLNDRDPALHDVYRLNIETGEREMVQKNTGMAGYMADDDFNIRFAVTFGEDASQILLQRDDKGEWTEFLTIPPLDAMTTSPAGFDKTGQKLYFIDSRDRDTSALTIIDLATGKQELIASNPKADVGGVMLHPIEKTVQAVSFNYDRKQWEVFDPAIKEDIAYLKSVRDGDVEITSRSLDDKQWTVAYIVDNGPVQFYRYDRESKKAHFLFSSRSDLDQYELAKMHPVIIKARDGLELVSYLTLPGGTGSEIVKPEKPLPLVLDVHGGPWARDGWGYNPTHQWLANRGYAVLSVNFRGSTGFGKSFTNAANHEWAGKMHDDLLDAVEWAVNEGIADRDKVAIMGGSYGGYATLVALTFTPEVFACGVDIVGPSSLVTLLNNVPPYWRTFMPVMKERVGDHTTDEGVKELLARSPLPLVDKIVRPLLIGQGANDPRVKQQEADQIVAAMEEHKIPVTYVLYPDEGHGFARPENSMSFNAVVEAFLAKNLGGRFEPVGDDFDGSKILVPAGADQVPGLAEALKEYEQQKAR